MVRGTIVIDLQDALTDAQELVNRTTEALNSGISTMTILQNTLKNSSDDFDAAARESLRGSMALLDKSLDILDSTTAMRRAGRTMKDTLDNELDKFDTDNRFLFMDPEAEKVSFTSDQNKAPKTLQIDLNPPEVLPPVQMSGPDAVGNGAAPAGEIPVRDMIRLQLDKGLVRLDLGRHIPPSVHPYLDFIFNGI